MGSKQFQYQGQDDQPAVIIRRDMSSGMNTRQHGTIIGESQAESLSNIDIGTPGERKKRPGSVTVGTALQSSQSATQLANFVVQGATDQLIAYCNSKIYKSESEAAFSEITGFTVTATPGFSRGKKSGISPDDVMWVCDGTNNWFEFQSDGTVVDLGSNDGAGVSDSPPSSKVSEWYGNRFWVLKNDQLYFSDAYDSDYSTSFDTTSNVFRIPVGEERALLATRDLGIVVAGENAIWALAPSATPAATDKPEPLIPNLGPVSNNAIISAQDDVYFFAQDGLRALKRTVQDKLQVGVSYPISYQMKTAFESISWGNIANLSMEYFDNKIFISVPTGSATFDTWIYYPATQGFVIMEDVGPRSWTKHTVDGDERLYYGSHGDGKVHRAWYGYTDEGTTTTNGTAITMTEIGRKEDMGSAIQWKTGGEMEIRCPATGNFTLSIYAQFDDANYVLLGTLALTGDDGANFATTGSVTFPVLFSDIDIVQVKVHLDGRRWRHMQVKFVHATTNDTKDITIYQHSIVAFPEKYQNE